LRSAFACTSTLTGEWPSPERTKSASPQKQKPVAYLPPYSPDLNPSEQGFAKVKHWLRMAEARSIEALHKHVGKLVAAIGAHECAYYLRKAGYTSS